MFIHIQRKISLGETVLAVPSARYAAFTSSFEFGAGAVAVLFEKSFEGEDALGSWANGTLLCGGAGKKHGEESACSNGSVAEQKDVYFEVLGTCMLPCAEAAEGMPHACPAYWLRAVKSYDTTGKTATEAGGSAVVECSAVRKGLSVAWITLSDKGAAGLRVDESGPAIGAQIRAAFSGKEEPAHAHHHDQTHADRHEHHHHAHAAVCIARIQGYLLPDDATALKALLTDLALVQRYDLIITTGGTGLSPRDVSPEATLAVIEKRLHGMEQAMMAASLAKTPYAMISRAVAGTLGEALIVNLPGSRKAVAENLAAILPALPHAIAKLQGDSSDCGS